MPRSVKGCQGTAWNSTETQRNSTTPTVMPMLPRRTFLRELYCGLLQIDLKSASGLRPADINGKVRCAPWFDWMRQLPLYLLTALRWRSGAARVG